MRRSSPPRLSHCHHSPYSGLNLFKSGGSFYLNTFLCVCIVILTIFIAIPPFEKQIFSLMLKLRSQGLTAT